MDITKVAKQLLSFLGQNPQLITQFIQHPYSTTAQATGSDTQISKVDMSQILTTAAALSNNQTLPASDVANISSALLGQNNNSIHSMASMLFGGGNTAQATQAAQQNTTPAGTLDLGSLVSMAAIAATLMGGMQQAQQAQQQAQQPVVVQQQASKPQVNLADGLSLGEIASLASTFLGGGSSTQAAAPAATTAVPKPQPAQQQAATQQQGLDFGTIAQLASMFLKQQ